MATKVQVCKGRIFFKGHAQRKQLARGAVIEGDGKIPISWRGGYLGNQNLEVCKLPK